MKKILFIIISFISLHANSQCVVNNNGVSRPCNHADSVYIAYKDSIGHIDSLAKALISSQHASTVASLKSKAYSVLNGLALGTTPTTAQQTAAFWIALWNAGAINPATNKVDSALNFIK